MKRLCWLCAVAVLTAFPSAGAGRYGQLLRVPRGYAGDNLRPAFFQALADYPNAFTELALFTPWTDEAETLDFHRRFLPKVRRFVEEGKRRGYSVGLNILPTVAFPENYATQRVVGAQSRLTERGDELTGTLCPRSTVTLDYVRDLVALYAGTGVDFIYLDDDVDLAHCHCPGCQKRFSELSGIPTWSSWDVRASLDSTNMEVRARARSAWIDLADENRALVYEAAAMGAHAVSTNIEVGCMTCNVALSDRSGELWSKALAGRSGTAVRWRPGGGCWSDQSRDALLNKLESNVLQTRGVPTAVKIQAELEVFPYHGLQKSAGFLGFESLLYVAWGCDSVTFNMLGPEPDALRDEFRGYLAKAESVAPSLERMHGILGKTPASGIGFAWGRFALTAPSRRWAGSSLVRRPVDFERIGLPVASDPGAQSVVLMDRDAAEGLTDAALTNVLSHGAYLDADALEVLTRRGYGEWLGFRVRGDAPRTAGFRDLGHPLNLPGGRIRRIHYSLGRGRESRIPLLEKIAAGAEFVSEAVALPFGGEHLGFNGGVFENDRGGRVAVCTQLPFVECEGLPRAEHLKRVMRWLSHDTLPGYVKSFHRVAIRARGNAFVAANFSCETLKDVEFAILGDRTFACSVFEGGEPRGELTLRPIGRDGAYSLYRLPELPNLGMVLMVNRPASERQSALEPLAPGEVKPAGWLRDWCETAKDGYIGHLDEIDEHFRIAWTTNCMRRGKGLHWSDSEKGSWSQEGGAYWFDGLVRLAWQLDDSRLKDYACQRLDTILGRMHPNAIGLLHWLDRSDERQFREVVVDGRGFGVWTSAIMGRALSAYYQVSRDARALRAMNWAYDDSRLYEFGTGRVMPSAAWEAFELGQDERVGSALDNWCAKGPDFSHVVWRYARKPDHMDFRPFTQKNHDWSAQHGVMACETAICALRMSRWRTGNPSWGEAVLSWVDYLRANCLQPYGVPVADESFGFTGPDRGTETCTVAADIRLNIELLRHTGQGRFGDRVERALFNAGAACTTADFFKHVYVQTPNRTVVENRGDFTCPPSARYYLRKNWPLCCTAALTRYVPDFVQHLWMKSPDGGLVATMYAPNVLTTELSGQAVRIVTETDYPFGETLRMSVEAAKPLLFPLRVRLPEWCAGPSVAVNGDAIQVTPTNGFVSLARIWRKDDVVTLAFPMKPVVERGLDRNKGDPGVPWCAVSAGPLLFARNLEGTDENTLRPDAKTDWRVDPAVVAVAAKLVRRSMPRSWKWEPEAMPVSVEIPTDAGPLALVPYGSTCLRVSMFDEQPKVPARSAAVSEIAGWDAAKEVVRADLVDCD